MCVRSIAIIVLALALSSAVSGTCQGSPPSSKTLKTPLVYRNAKYGFCLALPAGWAGFKVLTDLERGAVGRGIGAQVHHPEPKMDRRKSVSGHSDPGVHASAMAGGR